MCHVAARLFTCGRHSFREKHVPLKAPGPCIAWHGRREAIAGLLWLEVLHVHWRRSTENGVLQVVASQYLSALIIGADRPPTACMLA